MKNLCILSLLVIAGCATAKAAPQPGESAAAIALTYATLHGNAPVVTPDAPAAECDGSGVIRHGDGHTTPCPGCKNCRKAVSQLATLTVDDPLELTPAIYSRIRRIDAAPEPVPLVVTPVQCADGSCALPSRVTTSGSCADGSCGTASAGGPVRNVIKARPIRRVFRGIRERRPVRRLLGRLFGR